MRSFAAVLLLAAPLFAQPGTCTFAVTPVVFNVGAAASTLNAVTVTATPSTCDQGWVANSNASWMTITAATLNGSGSVLFSVAQNISGFARQGTLSIANTTVNVIQAAANCNYSVTPTSQNFPVTGGKGSFAVQANCFWQAGSNTPGIVQIPPNTYGIANATINYTVLPNGCVGSRTGSILIQTGLPTPPTFTVPQDGSTSNFSISATSAAADSTASDGRFTVTTGQGCGWSAASDVTWMQITSGANGSGNGGIAYHLAANSSATRTGNIRITTSPTTQLLYTVTQQAASAPTPQVAGVYNAANYAGDAVSPGQIVTLFGKNLGPAPLVPLQVSGGSLTTTLGGTQVLFDGVAAPMIYSFQTQVSAIAPYGLAGKSTTQVQVSYNGVSSTAIAVPVQPATPAIFTLDATGLGPGAILNQDYSVNGSGRPAARGSLVSIYCTGGGTTNPATPDGAVVGSTLPYLTLPVTVSIGGVDAVVQYKGGVPGAVAGLTQINAEVPAGVKPGTGIPVTITIGGVNSTPGVTMTVN